MILSDDVCLTKSCRATFDVEIDALLKRSVVRLQGPGGHAVVAKYRGVSSSNLSDFYPIFIKFAGPDCPDGADWPSRVLVNHTGDSNAGKNNQIHILL